MSPNHGTRVVLYIRVSTDKQAESGHSLDGQRARLMAYAEDHGLVVVDVVTDEGLSAGSLNRPGLQRAMELIRTRDATLILATKGDRLFRSVRDQVNVIADLEKAGGKIALTDEEFDTSTADGELLVNVRASVAQYERKLAGRRTREGMAAARAKGVRLGRPPVGYTVDPDKRGVLVPVSGDPVAAASVARREAAIERATQLRADGMSWRKVAEQFNAEGVPTVTGKVGKWEGKRVAKLAAADWPMS